VTSKRLRTASHWVTRPARLAPLPVLAGSGRGLRVRFGESTLRRVVRTCERDVEAALLGVLAPGDVVYDVGANIGWYTLLAARRVGPAGRVLAFEPGLANARYVQRNAASNGLANVTVVAAAVGEEDGWATFLDKGSLEGRLEAAEGDGDAHARRRAARSRITHARLPVPVLSLDAWIAATGQPPPDVVKLDVEGAEVAALRGMRATLREAAPTLVIELHATCAEVADLLDEAGYEHRPLERDVPTREAPGWAHVLASPQGASGANAVASA
jgi:FkbM family methyltransferase